MLFVQNQNKLDLQSHDAALPPTRRSCEGNNRSCRYCEVHVFQDSALWARWIPKAHVFERNFASARFGIETSDSLLDDLINIKEMFLLLFQGSRQSFFVYLAWCNHFWFPIHELHAENDCGKDQDDKKQLQMDSLTEALTLCQRHQPNGQG